MNLKVKTDPLPVDADALWREIGGFGAVGAWHPMLERVDTQGDGPGAIRTAHAKDGSTQVERLQELDAQGRGYRYAMESTPLPVRHYVGELRIRDNGDGTSTVIWSARFDSVETGDDDAVKMVEGFLQAGVNSLNERYG